MAGHVMEYHPPISWIKEFMHTGNLGRIVYFSFQRTIFETTRPGANGLWDLVVNDLSILCYLLNVEPAEINARGSCCLESEVHDVLFLTIGYSDDVFFGSGPCKPEVSCEGGNCSQNGPNDLDKAHRFPV